MCSVYWIFFSFFLFCSPPNSQHFFWKMLRARTKKSMKWKKFCFSSKLFITFPNSFDGCTITSKAAAAAAYNREIERKKKGTIQNSFSDEMGEMIINEIDTVTGLPLTGIMYSECVVCIVHHEIHDAYTRPTKFICVFWWMVNGIRFTILYLRNDARNMPTILIILFFFA